MRYLRGDLSAPVLAILVTIGIIAAGLILLAWFWWFAPSAGRTGSIQILGTPTFSASDKTLYISIRNTGNDDVNMTQILVSGVTCSIMQPTTGYVIVKPGQSESIVARCTNVSITNEKTVNGVIMTNYGTYSFTAAVV